MTSKCSLFLLFLCVLIWVHVTLGERHCSFDLRLNQVSFLLFHLNKIVLDKSLVIQGQETFFLSPLARLLTSVLCMVYA